MPRKSVSEKSLRDMRFIIELSSEGKRAILDFSMKEGLIGCKYECPICHGDMKLVEYESIDGFRWRCEKYGEKKHVVNRSVRSGSLFEASKISIVDILIMARAWVEQYGNSQIARLARVNSQTVTDWVSLFKEISLFACVGESSNLGGENKIVEIEILSGNRDHSKREFTFGEWVFGGVQHDSKEYFFEVVPDKSKETLLKVIQRRILPGTIVISDYWRTYKCLQDEGYKNFSVNQKVTFKDPATGACSNAIEGLWSPVKCKLHGKKQVEGTFDPNLAEFMWRRRYKNDPDELFLSFLKAVINIYPPRIKDEEQNSNEVELDANGPQPGPSWKKTKYEKKDEN